MARFVCFTDGLVGSLQRILELGRRLDAAGHEVVIASPVDVEDDVGRLGLGFVHLGELDRLRADLDRLPRPSVRRPSPSEWLSWLRAGRAARRASLADRSIERVLDDVRPDLALVELEFHVAAMACSAAGVPVALTTGWFCALRTDAPPLDSPLRPGVATADEVERAWESTLAGHRRAIRRAVLSASGLAAPFRPIRPVTWNPLDLRAVARTRGVRFRRVLETDHWPRPYLFADVPIVSFTPSHLEFAPVPDRWRSVGAMVPPADRALDRSSAADRAALDAVLAEHREQRGGADARPLVFVGLGTYWSGGAPLLRTILAAARRRPDLRVVVGLGGATDRDSLGEVPDHVTVLDWAPQVEILAEASAAVIHGGVTSLLECLRAAVPMVCLSTHTNDQDGTVARAMHAGVAIDLDHRTVTADELAAALKQVLADEGMRGRCAELAARLTDDESSDLAVRTVTSLLE